jgi:hypothetical protein
MKIIKDKSNTGNYVGPRFHAGVKPARLKFIADIGFQKIRNHDEPMHRLVLGWETGIPKKDGSMLVLAHEMSATFSGSPLWPIVRALDPEAMQVDEFELDQYLGVHANLVTELNELGYLYVSRVESTGKRDPSIPELERTFSASVGSGHDEELPAWVAKRMNNPFQSV